MDDDEPWRDLKVGDCVRIVRIPTHFSEPGSFVAPETIAFYQFLIDNGGTYTIYLVDEWDHPWIEHIYHDEKGEFSQCESVALNDDSWERVT